MNDLNLLNNHRLADITRLNAMIKRGCTLFKYPNASFYQITETDIERAKKTLVNLSPGWTLADLPKLNARIKEQEQMKAKKSKLRKLGFN